MELNADKRPALVPDSHTFVLRCGILLRGPRKPCDGGGNSELGRDFERNERVVSSGDQGIRKSAKNAEAVVPNGRSFAVTHLLGAADTAPQRGNEALVPQAYAQERPDCLATNFHGDSRFGRGAGARRDDDRVVGARERVGCGQRVIAYDVHTGTEDADRLHQVEREAVVVVDEKDPHGRLVS